MDTTRCLREEHQVILKVLDCLEIALHAGKRDAVARNETYAPFIEFFRDFADRCHHCKEEDRLFPCLESCGMPHDHGPIAVMLADHRQGRAHVRAMAESLPAADAGDALSIRTVLEQGEAFLHLLRHHIMKEDHALFEMADEMIDSHKRIKLKTEYAKADADAHATLDRCRTIAAKLCEKYAVQPPPPAST